VDRNRIKRIARESFRTRRDLPNWDFVVIAKPDAARADRALLRQSLGEHFHRLKRRALRDTTGTQ
jgi:ribonuclease P protein component